VTDATGSLTVSGFSGQATRGSTAYQVRARSASGDVSDAVETSPSSPNVITASDGSGDVSIGY
jgi:phage-related baseplate assembly protein